MYASKPVVKLSLLDNDAVTKQSTHLSETDNVLEVRMEVAVK